MYRIGYIDDNNNQADNFAKKIARRRKDLCLIFLDRCITKEDFLERILEEQVDVLLVDYKMAASYGVNGTKLIQFINNNIHDLECYIFTAVDQQEIDDGLVRRNHIKQKSIFDTGMGDQEREAIFTAFLDELKESAEVFQRRRNDNKKRYLELKQSKEAGAVINEEEYRELHMVLSSYGMIEKVSPELLGA